MLHRQPTIEEMRAALEASKLPPKEGFERMVRTGIINAKGQVTKLVGGSADPEPGARRPVMNSNGETAPALNRQPTIEEMRAALEASKLPPKEGFERMVRDGIINAKGQVTRLVGGSAEPEPGARRPTTRSNGQE